MAGKYFRQRNRRDRSNSGRFPGVADEEIHNAIPRPPVIFCSDGKARVVVRRETYEDLASRDAV